jgi:hypothetical protein
LPCTWPEKTYRETRPFFISRTISTARPTSVPGSLRTVFPLLKVHQRHRPTLPGRGIFLSVIFFFHTENSHINEKPAAMTPPINLIHN